MKSIILILLLFPILSFSQQQGKIVRNQSLKVEVVWMPEDSIYLCKIYNMNSCDSYIEIDFGSGPFITPIKTKQFDYEQVALKEGQILKVRNATLCANGTTSWLTITTTRDAANLKISKLQQSRSYESDCDIQPYRLPIKIPTHQPNTDNPPNDNNTRTKL